MNKQYNINMTVIDSEIKAYLLGLIFADGYIAKEQKQVSISLNEYDVDILDKIAISIDCSPPFYKHPDKNRYSNNGQFVLSMAQLYDDLYIYKDKDVMPLIPDNLIHHFIRGLFDGDGTISIDRRSNKYNFTSGTFYIMLNNKNIAESISKTIAVATGLSQTSIYARTGNGTEKVWVVRWSGTNNIISIRDFLYNNATIYLARKKCKMYTIRAGKKEAWNKGTAEMSTLICSTCGKSFNRRTKLIRDSKKSYCNKECYSNRSLQQPKLLL